MTMVVRNEADMLPVVLRHHLTQGVDSIHVIDHSSTDATPRLLGHLRAVGLPIAWRRWEGPFDQDAMVAELTTEAAEAGADWIVTVDGDELWQVRGGFKAYLAGRDGVDAVSVPVVNFVQWRYARSGTPAALCTLVARPVRHVHKHAYESLPAGARLPWVVRQEIRKLIARSGRLLAAGAHVPHDASAVVRRSSLGVCLHAPLRSPVALANKHRVDRVAPHGDLAVAWRENSWVVPTRVGDGRASAPLRLDLRVARIALRHLRQARLDLAAAAQRAPLT
jgi:hypothetical protein